MSSDDPQIMNLATMTEAFEGSLEKIDLNHVYDSHSLFKKLNVYSSSTKGLALNNVLDIFSHEVQQNDFLFAKDMIYDLIDWEKEQANIRIYEEFDLVKYNSEERQTFPRYFDGRCSRPYCDLCHSVMAYANKSNKPRNLRKYYKVLRIEILHQVQTCVHMNALSIFEKYRHYPFDVQQFLTSEELVQTCKQHLRKIGMVSDGQLPSEADSEIDDSNPYCYHSAQESCILKEHELSTLEGSVETSN
jgi:hypothetical protein